MRSSESDARALPGHRATGVRSGKLAGQDRICDKSGTSSWLYISDGMPDPFPRHPVLFWLALVVANEGKDANAWVMPVQQVPSWEVGLTGFLLIRLGMTLLPFAQ